MGHGGFVSEIAKFLRDQNIVPDDVARHIRESSTFIPTKIFEIVSIQDLEPSEEEMQGDAFAGPTKFMIKRNHQPKMCYMLIRRNFWDCWSTHDE